MFTTVEELRAHIVAHCGVDCTGEDQYDCVKLASQELRDEYVAKYGCICGSHCQKCCEWNGCFPTDEDKQTYLNH